MTVIGSRMSVFGFWGGAALLCLLLAACSQRPAPVVEYGTEKGAGSNGIHTVLDGDTVYTVAKDYRLPIRDIISVNSLHAPYFLNVGYRLKLPAPREYRVQPKDTLRAIAMQFETTVNDLVRLNSLTPPYKLKAGQVLRLPSPVDTGDRALVQSASFPAAAPVASVPVSKVEREVLSAPLPPKTASASLPQPAVVYTPAPPPPPSAKATVQQASATAGASAVKPDIAPDLGKGRFMRPVQGKVISAFGPKPGGLHNDGINIQAPSGTPVRAAGDGSVVYSGDGLEGYGNLILIRHADGWMTAYAHLGKTLAAKGDKVKRGQSIGTVGSTGQVDTPQLHFEVRRGTEAKDPALYL